MALYYVKLGGSKTTGSTADQSGNSFATIGAANYYDTIEDAMTGGAAQGDNIYVSDLHVFDAGASAINYVGGDGTSSGPPLQIYSVDDTDAGVYKVAAAIQEHSDTAILFAAADSFTLHGISISSNSSIYGAANSSMECWDCTFNLLTTNDNFGANADGCMWKLHNCTLHSASTGSIYLTGGSSITMYGGAITHTTSWLDLFDTYASTNGGGIFNARGTDMSSVTNILPDVGATRNTDDLLRVTLDKCAISAASALQIEEAVASDGVSLAATNCSSVSIDAEWQFYYEDLCGIVTTVDTGSVVRVDTDTTRVFPGGETVSYKVVTTAVCGESKPFYFDLPASYLALSNAATDTIAIYFACDNVALTDVDVFAEVLAADGTNKNVWNYYTNKNANPLLLALGGTAHTDDSGSSVWEDNSVALGGTWNEFVMKVDCSSAVDAAADCVPTVRVCVTRPSTTVYFAMHVDAVAS